MTIHFIGAGPGAADLITVRGLRLLQTSSVCLYAGSLVSRSLIEDNAPKDARIVNTAAMTLDEIVDEMVHANDQGRDVARVHSGDPSIYSAMNEQMRRLDLLQISYDVTPGVTAFAAAAAAMNQELTIPTVNQSLVLTRTSRNSTAMPENETLQRLALAKATMVIHLSAGNLYEAVDQLIECYGGDCPAILASRVSWPDETIIKTTLKNVVRESTRANLARATLLFVGRALDGLYRTESYLYSNR